MLDTGTGRIEKDTEAIPATRKTQPGDRVALTVPLQNKGLFYPVRVFENRILTHYKNSLE